MTPAPTDTRDLIAKILMQQQQGQVGSGLANKFLLAQRAQQFGEQIGANGQPFKGKQRAFGGVVGATPENMPTQYGYYGQDQHAQPWRRPAGPATGNPLPNQIPQDKPLPTRPGPYPTPIQGGGTPDMSPNQFGSPARGAMGGGVPEGIPQGLPTPTTFSLPPGVTGSMPPPDPGQPNGKPGMGLT
jgi:hypothetical protein